MNAITTHEERLFLLFIAKSGRGCCLAGGLVVYMGAPGDGDDVRRRNEITLRVDGVGLRANFTVFLGS